MQTIPADQDESSLIPSLETPSSPPASPFPSSPLSPTFLDPRPALISLPPPAPNHSVWQCCACRHVYRFSAVRNRCLLCSHRFCKKCPDEHDHDGWGVYTKFWTSITPPTTKELTSSLGDYWGDEALFWEPLQDKNSIGKIDEEVESSSSSGSPESPIEEREENGWTSDWLFDREDDLGLGMQVKLAPAAPQLPQRRYSHPHTQPYPRPTTPLKALMEKENRTLSLNIDTGPKNGDVQDAGTDSLSVAALEGCF